MSLQNEIEDMREHLAVLNDHSSTIDKTLTDIRIEMTNIKTDVCWMKKFFWLITGASVSSLIVGLFNLILKEL